MTDRASRTELIEDATALAAVVPDWTALWSRCPGATPFSSPAWLVPWWAAFAPGRLATLAVREDGRLVAFAPLWIEHGPLGRRLLPLGIGISDHLDVLVDPDAAAAGERLACAMAEIGDWTSCSLEELAPGAASLSLPTPPGCSDEIRQATPCPVLSWPAGREALSAVPAGQRRKIRMAQHRTARRSGIVAIVEDGFSAFLAELCRLHGARWDERGGVGVLADERVRRFHAAALPGLAAAGLLHATTLTMEGGVVAAYYGLRDGRNAYAYIGGFDPAFAFESPGTVLIADALDAAGRGGAGSFHFLRGQEAYKYAWGATDRVSRTRTFQRECAS